MRDEAEADKILDWLKDQINETWERRHEIEPRFEGPSKPKILESLKLLPRTNCRQCGQPTCMVFATQLAEGARGPENCPALSEDNRRELEDYLNQFQLDQ